MKQLDYPPWLKQRVPAEMTKVRELMSDLKLNTVCQSAACPNLGECFGRNTATFLILGGVCTRNCRFCDIPKGKPDNIDPEEPVKLVKAVQKLGLQHVVITSVTRDDLIDGGAGHFADSIQKIREGCPGVTVEVLIPDFLGDEKALNLVLAAKPDVLNHNVETVPRLYPKVRPSADYRRSLELLHKASLAKTSVVKTGMMLGLGEDEKEVVVVFADLLKCGVSSLTLGQYLRPSKDHLPVFEYIHPERFHRYEEIALKQGFTNVAAGPFVRSSYHAAEFLRQNEGTLSSH